MLKKIYIGSLSIVILLMTGGNVWAISQSPTPTPTPLVSQTEEQINNLKDRIASRVAQLNLVEKKGIIGTIADISETQLSVTDSQGNTQLVDVDELTKFSSPTSTNSTKSFGISDLTKGSSVGIIGLYNKDSRRLLARWVDVLNSPKVLSGAILSINKDAFTFAMATNSNDTVTISVEDITKTLSYSKATGLIRSGFSKMSSSQRVLVVGFPDKNDKTTIIASRVVIFVDIPANPKIPLIKPDDIAPVSTGSGNKLTPITNSVKR